MSTFKLHSEFQPTGDQPEAIRQLVEGLNDGIAHQTLLGVTGSGKTFSIANVIERSQRPTLVLSHNKTLASQLYSEFKEFFPDNLVEYFVSYYDYYQPEAYIPSSGTYIEKDLAINEEIEKLRLSATSALLSGRRDVIVVASISCIYGIGNPVEFHKSVIEVKVGQVISRNALLHRLVESLYHRTRGEFSRGLFRVNGDVVDVFLAYADHAVRIHFWGNEIERIETIDPEHGPCFTPSSRCAFTRPTCLSPAKTPCNSASGRSSRTWSSRSNGSTNRAASSRANDSRNAPPTTSR